MIIRLVVLAILTGLLRPPISAAAASDIDDVVKEITKQLASTGDPQAQAKLYCFRARNYAQNGDSERAQNDYLRALNASYEGWILNELGFFMFKIGEFEKAYNVSTRVLSDFPHLKQEAAKLRSLAKKKWEEDYLKNNPPTITLDSVPDPHRITRHDLIDQRKNGTQNKKQQPEISTEPISTHWGKHPATKHIPVPERKRLEY